MTVQGVRNTKVGQAEGTGPFFHAWIFPLTIPLVSPCVQCKLYLTMSKQCLPANISKLLAWEFYGHADDNKFLASRFRLLYFLHHESLYSSFNRKLFVIRGHSTAALLCSSLLLSHKKSTTTIRRRRGGQWTYNFTDFYFIYYLSHEEIMMDYTTGTDRRRVQRQRGF